MYITNTTITIKIQNIWIGSYFPWNICELGFAMQSAGFPKTMLMDRHAFFLHPTLHVIDAPKAYNAIYTVMHNWPILEQVVDNMLE